MEGLKALKFDLIADACDYCVCVLIFVPYTATLLWGRPIVLP